MRTWLFVSVFVVVLVALALALLGCSSTETTTHSTIHCTTTTHGAIEDSNCVNDSSHSVNSKGL